MVSLAHFRLCSIICTTLSLSEHLLFLRAVFLSSPPPHLPPVGQHLPQNICNLFKSPPESFVLSSHHLPLQHPSISITALPVSVLVFHGHPLVLRQALYLPYSETTLPQGFIFPQSTVTFPSAMSDASVRSPVPQGHLSSVQIPSRVPNCARNPLFVSTSMFPPPPKPS